MSRAAKLTLGASSLVAGIIVVAVHYQQKLEQSTMHQGVLDDMERQRIKRERQLDFDAQRALESAYRQVQSVHESDIDAPPPKEQPRA